MAQPQDHISMALFCDFENVALGVRDANYEKFDIKRVLERLLLKGSIVVKKSYCDWERYKGFKAAMHEANFELIEIPHVRQSGKNSADIRLVVDALDLCYTKSHVNTFVIISGDSDFSPLVSKLRENAKYVIGVGVKQSTSDLLIANCDEFIFYDDLVRESQRQRSQGSRDQQPQQRRSPEEERRRREEMDTRRTKVVEMAAETYEALVTDRDEGGRVWASVLKEALKRRNPGFSEQYYGFRTFGNLLEEAQARGLLELGRDEKSGLFVSRGNGVPSKPEAMPAGAHAEPLHHGAEAAAMVIEIDAFTSRGATVISAEEPVIDVDAVVIDEAGEAVEQAAGQEEGRRPARGRGRQQRGGRSRSDDRQNAAADAAHAAATANVIDASAAPAQPPAAEPAPSQRRASTRQRHRGRAAEAVPASDSAPAPAAPAPAPAPAPAREEAQAAPTEAGAETPAKQSTSRPRRPRKPSANASTKTSNKTPAKKSAT